MSSQGNTIVILLLQDPRTCLDKEPSLESMGYIGLVWLFFCNMKN